MKITNCTLYFANLLSIGLHPHSFIAVTDKPRNNGFYTASIWVGSPKDIVWSLYGSTEYISSEIEPQASHRTRMIIDDIEVRKSRRKVYVELCDVGLYTRKGWEVVKVDNATIFQPRLIME